MNLITIIKAKVAMFFRQAWGGAHLSFLGLELIVG